MTSLTRVSTIHLTPINIVACKYASAPLLQHAQLRCSRISISPVPPPRQPSCSHISVISALTVASRTLPLRYFPPLPNFHGALKRFARFHALSTPVQDSTSCCAIPSSTHTATHAGSPRCSGELRVSMRAQAHPTSPPSQRQL